MQLVSIINDTQGKALALTIVAIACLTALAAIAVNEAMIVIIPSVFIMAIIFLRFPEIGLGAVIVGQNLFGITLTAVGVEKPILAYAPYSMISLASLVILALKGRTSLPKRGNLVIAAVFAVTMLIVFNYYRTDFPEHTAVKAATYMVACLVPFVSFSLLKLDESNIPLIFKSAVVIGLLPIVFSLFSVIFSGAASGFGRFNAIELVNVNQYARNIGYVSIFAVWWFFNTHSKFLRAGLVSFVAMSFAIIIMTGSRTSLLATMGAIFLYIALFSGLSLKRKAISISAVTAGIGVPMFLGFGSMLRRFSSLQYVDMSLAGRVGMWKAAWEHRWDRVLFGHGTGNFATILPAWAVAAGLRHPHNLIIEYYFEWGVIGLIVFTLVFSAPIFLWQNLRKTKSESYLMSTANFLIVLVAFSFVNGMIDSSAADPQLYTSLGLMTAVFTSSRERAAKCI